MEKVLLLGQYYGSAGPEEGLFVVVPSQALGSAMLGDTPAVSAAAVGGARIAVADMPGAAVAVVAVDVVAGDRVAVDGVDGADEVAAFAAFAATAAGHVEAADVVAASQAAAAKIPIVAFRKVGASAAGMAAYSSRHHSWNDEDTASVRTSVDAAEKAQSALLPEESIVAGWPLHAPRQAG